MMSVCLCVCVWCYNLCEKKDVQTAVAHVLSILVVRACMCVVCDGVLLVVEVVRW